MYKKESAAIIYFTKGGTKQDGCVAMLVKAPPLPFLPTIVIPTKKTPIHCWHAWRRSGIGGSDVAKILGICPFGTKRDLYYSKKGIVDAVDEEQNKWQKLIGQRMEDTVAEMFSEITGYPIFKLPFMFRSPDHPFMLADLDYGCILPDGSIAILECKTTAPDAKMKWWKGKQPVIPINYQYQGRHYMSVMRINKVFFACLYGNSENYFVIRELNRDMDIESEMIFLEKDFWVNSVQASVPPPYTEAGELCEESVRRHHGPADTSAPLVTLSDNASLLVPRYLEIGALLKQHNAIGKTLENERKRIKSIITDEMGTGCAASCMVNGEMFTVTFNPVYTPAINKENLITLQAQKPDVYEEYVTLSEQRRFSVKHVREAAA